MGGNTLGVHASVFVAGWNDAEVDRALQATKRAGFHFIEIPLLNPGNVDAVSTRKKLEEYGLSVTCSLGLGFASDISSPDQEIVKRGESLLMEALDVASALDSSYLGGVLYSAMGKYVGPAWPGAEAQVADVLRRLAARAGERGITIGLEPVNRYESNLVNSARQALALIRLTEATNIVVHLDVYHMNIEEGDLEQPVLECGQRLGYVHVGESHRGYLGTGTIDFPQFFRALARAGYEGPIAFESFSSAVVSRDFSSALAIWRDLWDDGEDLARAAREFIDQQLHAAGRAVNLSISDSDS
ncbi:MAG: sugar phosphate isomerase/epimerase [Actinomycetota bacterium]|jgi:D-psicose/D-tagatose/L-ribulose 3-epimerase|nr:sugar phosphate isomerase/epimerase [Actinomycetota bacterium]